MSCKHIIQEQFLHSQKKHHALMKSARNSVVKERRKGLSARGCLGKREIQKKEDYYENILMSTYSSRIPDSGDAIIDTKPCDPGLYY